MLIGPTLKMGPRSDFFYETGHRYLDLTTLEISTIRAEASKERENYTKPNIENSHEVNLLLDSYEEYLNGRDKRIDENLAKVNARHKAYLRFLKGKVASVHVAKKNPKYTKEEGVLWRLIFYQRYYPTTYGYNTLRRYEALYPEVSKKIRQEIYMFKNGLKEK